MSFAHLIYIGHITNDGENAIFVNSEDDPLLRPSLVRPLEMNIVQEIASSMGVQDLFPEDWGLWLESGYLVGEHYSLSLDAKRFIASLCKRTNCVIVDFKSRTIVDAP